MELNVICFICNEPNANAKSTLVSQVGLQTIIHASNIRQDGHAERLKNVDKLRVHEKCRLQYTRKRDIDKLEASNRHELSNSIKMKLRRRSSRELGSVLTECILCGQVIPITCEKPQLCKEKEERIPTYKVTTAELGETLLKEASIRNDEWGKAITARINKIPDLVAAEAMYHENCWQNYCSTYYEVKKAQPEPAESIPDVISQSMNQIYNFLENADECQFTFDELTEKINGYQPDPITIKKYLVQRYGSNITITNVPNGESVVSFASTDENILSDAYIRAQNRNEDEKLAIIKEAAEIIRNDIRSTYYETNKYPPCNTFLQDAENDVPESLKTVLEGIIMKGKKETGDVKRRKSIAISHSIIAATRPTSYISSIQLALSVFLHRKFESKSLVNTMSNLGFGCSYDDTLTFLQSGIMKPLESILPEAFCQFAFGNADFNVLTVDGLNTFQVTGGIQIITPTPYIRKHHRFEKLKKKLSRKEIAALPIVPIRHYSPGTSVQNVEFEDVTSYMVSTAEFNSIDALYFTGKNSNSEKLLTSGWNRFMDVLTNNMNHQKSAVVYLPFINMPATNTDTISTTLHLALRKARQLRQKQIFVTYDQPLYIKAEEIVRRTPILSERIVVRLGGFHMLMSYLGSIGFIMAGSGIKECLSEIYAPNCVDMILNGHAYARAIRAHLLLQEALIMILFRESDDLVNKNKRIQNLVDNFEKEPSHYDKVANDRDLTDLSQKMNILMEDVSRRGRTAKMWIQYIKMVNILKHYITAERLGLWDSHLNCMKNMLPYFHSSGNFLYAKSTQLYIQTMGKLEKVMDHENYTRFTEGGCFSICHTDRRWAGISADYVLDTTLMRSMKSQGLTHGRGVSDSAVRQWLLSTPVAAKVCDSLENFCGTYPESSHQHEDWNLSISRRDQEDINKITGWFTGRNPFPFINEIVSLSSGMTASKDINCDQAFEVGLQMVQKCLHSSFHDIKFERSSVIRSLGSIMSKVEIEDADEIVLADPLLLFQRICQLKKEDDVMKKYLAYELAPFPQSLFDQSGMRKSTKSSLYSFFSTSDIKELPTENVHFVIDGEYLLHRVESAENIAVSEMCQNYISYVKTVFPPNSSVTIVFNVYQSALKANNSKVWDWKRRYDNSLIDTVCNESAAFKLTQAEFLSSDENKTLLIDLLWSKFREVDIQVILTTGNASTSIVKSALNIAKKQTAVVVGENVDLLVLLIGLSCEQQIYFWKASKEASDFQVYFIPKIIEMWPGIQNVILVAHALSGCHTTSCFYKKGKINCLKALLKEDLKSVSQVFLNPSSSKTDISLAANRFVLAIYGAGKTKTTVNDWRFTCFTRSPMRKVDLASLPPTEDSLQQHSYRAYFQVQTWLGNENIHSPEEWGWKLTDEILYPVQMIGAPAPSNLLKMISCKCKTLCRRQCSCKKAGLKCSVICSLCSGECDNAATIQVIDDTNNDFDTRSLNSDEEFDEIDEVIVNSMHDGSNKVMLSENEDLASDNDLEAELGEDWSHIDHDFETVVVSPSDPLIDCDLYDTVDMKEEWVTSSYEESN